MPWPCSKTKHKSLGGVWVRQGQGGFHFTHLCRPLRWGVWLLGGVWVLFLSGLLLGVSGSMLRDEALGSDWRKIAVIDTLTA